MEQQANPDTLKISKGYVHQCFLAITTYVNQEELKAPKGKEAKKAFEHVRLMLRYLEAEVHSVTQAATLMSTLKALNIPSTKDLTEKD